jgi:unsaturated rhamnogalacturonyl hydrolase
MLRQPAQVIPEQQAVVARVANWITQEQERLPDGTFWRPNATDVSKVMKPGTIWADDLYMGCPFLVRWAQYTGDPKSLHDAAQNVINMAARLQDKDGVWFHAYFEAEKKHSPWKWGRANGWAIIATVEILSALPDNNPDREKLLNIYRRHVAGLKTLQSDSGIWRQVLDQNESWDETSCAAMFAYAIARGVNRGWLPAGDMAVARKTFTGLCATAITPDGAVNGTCEGTNIGVELEFYANRKRPADDLRGRGGVLLAGTEILAGKK